MRVLTLLRAGSLSLADFTLGMEDLVFNANRNRSGLTAAGKTGNILKS